MTSGASPQGRHATTTAGDADDETVHLEGVDTVNYALAHNGIPVVHRVTLDNPRDSDLDADLTVQLVDAEGELGTPWRRRVSLRAGSTVVIDDVDLRADPAALLQVDEQRPGAVTARLSTGGDTLGRSEHDVRVLASNQWLSTGSLLDFELLAAFVIPNHPAIAAAMTEVSDALGRRTGNSAIDGYQSGDERVDAIVAAVFETVQARHIRYAEPPASWGDQGQKIRTPAQVLDEKFGTCLDTVVVMAAMLEQAGVHPLLWMAEGHAFLGWWREETSLSQIVQLDTRSLLNQVALGNIGVVETTMATDRTDDVSFIAAQGAVTQRWVDGDSSALLAVVDVFRARSNGILPLPARTRDARGEVVVTNYVPAEHSVPTLIVQGGRTARPRPEDAPSRVQNWKNALLDLSLRNRLINLPAHRAAFNVILPSAALGTLEDLMSADVAFSLIPADDIDDIHAARGGSSARDLDGELVLEALVTRKRLFTSTTRDTYASKLRSLAYKARTIEEDTGANNLYLTLGSLVWNLDGRELRSPLILMPVTLKPATRGQAFRLQLDPSGGSTPNFCLLEKLRQVHDLTIPALAEPEVDQSGIDLDATLQAVRVAVSNAGLSARVEASADVAILQFAKFRLWKDLDENWQTFSQNSLVLHLLKSPNDPFRDPVVASGNAPDLDALAASLPISADSSQLGAVARATAGTTFVLEGPPGTGKSQTITNLLAHAMAEGRRVLFVAEKRAALDVVRRRLDAVGMGAFALDLHDKASKPATVRAQIKQALDSVYRVDEHGLLASGEEARTSARILGRYAGRLHEPNAAGLSLYSAHERALAYGDGVTLPVPRSVLAGEPRVLDGVRAALRAVPEQADDARPRPLHPWGFVEVFDAAAIEQLRERAERADQAVGALPSRPDITAVLRTVRAPDELRTLADMCANQTVTLEALDATRQGWWQDQTQRFARDVQVFTAAAHPGLDVATPAALELPIPDILGRARAAAATGFFGRKKRLAAVAAELAPVLQDGRTVAPKRVVELLEALAQVQGASRELARQAGNVAGLAVPPAWNPLTPEGSTIVESQLRWLRWAGGAVATTQHDRGFVGALRALKSSNAGFSSNDVALMIDAADALEAVFQAPGVSTESVAVWCGDKGLLEAWFATSMGRGTGAVAARGLTAWRDLLRALEPLRACGMTTAREMVARGAVDADVAAEALERGIAAASVPERADATGLTGFDTTSHVNSIEKFLRSSAALRELLHDELPRRVVASRPFDPATGMGQVGALQRELVKQRKGMSVRKMLDAYGELIVAAMPCVLVSPESVSRFFPAIPNLFDLVVFDEASQIRVADAVGSMGRARSVVVVGDSKQMPPTSFAEASTGSQDDDVEDDDVVTVEDEESILSECVQARVPRDWLSWHYRSQDESLIAFSNHRYYEDRLSSFPSPAMGEADPGPDGRGVSFIRVDGTFQRSGRGKALRTNLVEATAVVDDIRRRFAASPDEAPSVGVVTFNIQQRTLIESMLRDLGDERVNAALDDRTGEGVFVKNLENVQGDERDTILFSVAFSRNERGYLPLNFGPLNRGGGERRLNVAVTRARRQVVVYCSFDPAELRSEQTSSVGIKHLRAYLDFAAASSRTVSASVARSPVDRHRDAVASALRGRGLDVVADVGMSDFRVDVVASRSGALTGSAVAILLDGPAWAGRGTVGDRDGLPVEVLTNLLEWPAVERVWLPEWLAQPEAVLDRIERACAEAAAPKPAVPVRVAVQSPPPAAAVVPVTPQMLVKSAPSVPDLTWRLAGELAYVPAATGQRGERRMLDELPRRHAAEAVRAVVLDVIEQEGPISRDRLARVVAGAFDLTRVNAGRASAILATVPSSVVTSERRSFLWPTVASPETWTAFRRADDDAPRALEEVSLREIGNAMVALCAASGGMVADELLREALRIFGGKRVTVSIGARLRSALAAIESDRRVRLEGDVVLVNAA